MVAPSYNLFDYQQANGTDPNISLSLVITEEQGIENALKNKRELLSIYRLSDITRSVVERFFFAAAADYLIAYYINKEIEFRKKALGTLNEQIEIPFELYEWKENFLKFHLDNDLKVLHMNFRNYWLKFGKGYYRGELLLWYLKNELGIGRTIHLEAA